MSILEKLHTLIIFFAVILGLFLGQFLILENYSGYFIIPFLFLMLYGLFLNIPIKDLKASFTNVKFAGTSLIINFLWTPLLAWALGSIFLSDHPALWIGFIMLMVTPCTDWYLIFTGIAKGNVPLSASILPLNLLVQVLLLPVYLLLFTGIMGTIKLSVLVESVVIVLFLPFLLANLTKYILNIINRKNLLEDKILPFFTGGQMIFLSLAILAMFASQGKYLVGNFSVVYILLIPILLFFLVNFILVRMLGTLLQFSYKDSASLNLTTLARNSPIALAIAVTTFPDQPLIALALVIGPLIELPMLTVISHVLLKIKQTKPTSLSL